MDPCPLHPSLTISRRRTETQRYSWARTPGLSHPVYFSDHHLISVQVLQFRIRDGDITQNGADEGIQPDQANKQEPAKEQPVKSSLKRAMDSSLDLADIDLVAMASPTEYLHDV